MAILFDEHDHIRHSSNTGQAGMVNPCFDWPECELKFNFYFIS